MSSSDSVTERSFYPVIMELAKKISEELGVKVVRVSEIGVGGKFPDILLELDGHRILVEVKIDSERKLLDDLTKTYPIATSKGSGVLLLLLPSEAKRIYPTELEKAAPKIRVKRGILLTSWASRHSEEIELERFLRLVVETVKEFKTARKPIVDYTTIALVSRETIEELAGAIRQYIMTNQKLFNQAQAVIGRFDFYKSLLEDLVENKEIIKTYIADIMAYIVVLSLLFLHIASVKRLGKSVLPRIENPVSPPQGTLGIIERNVKTSPLYNEYKFIGEPLIYILDLLSLLQERINHTLARYIYSIQALKPEYVNEELLGRIYQEGLPPETRKNLGAFFTNPIAARLLAYLAIEKWDEKVLDPACGSGTLLVSAYEAKMKKALERGLDRSDAHRVFLKEHIVGIDVMQFAKELSSINLSLQHVEAPLEPRIFWGDGIQKMITAIENPEDDPPLQPSLMEWIVKDRESYLKHHLTREGFDLVIMNPPFTRRERIPESERNKLEKALGKIVRGKVGYWAYFFTAADNVIKTRGKLAAVTPEEFFAGRNSESVRRYLFMGEIKSREGWAKVSRKIYIPQIIIKSSIDVAFSEQALYRDYLVIFRKVLEEEAEAHDRCVIVTLKKKHEEIKGKEEELASLIKRILQEKDSSTYSNEFFDALVLNNVTAFTKNYVDNLKPLVFFNSAKTLELFYQLTRVHGLKRLDEIAILRDYTCQYTGKGFEDYVRKLFISRYEARAPTMVFELLAEENNFIKVKPVRGDVTLSVPKGSCVRSLRTYAGVKHMDVTGEEEFAIIDPNVIDRKVAMFVGLADKALLSKATNDIREAYDEIAGHALLVRRARLTSDNLYWLAYYSDNKILGPSAPMICLKLKEETPEYYKILTLYLNSSITFLQLLAYLAMNVGAWVALHSDQAWSHVLVPDPESIPADLLKRALGVFNEVARADNEIQPLYTRYTSKSSLQRKIDKVALELIGLEWSDKQLESLYDSIKFELDIMWKILEESQRRKGTSERKEESEDEEEESESRQSSLLDWFKK